MSLRMHSNLANLSEPDGAMVLTKAVLRVAGHFSMTQSDLAETLGMSHATMSRVARGERMVELSSKEGELASLLVRAFRSVDAILGGNIAQIHQWFHAYNEHVQGIPKETVKTVTGLVRLVQYLDAMRAKI